MSKRVTVLGAGVIGLSVAAECARRGHRVTVVERGPARRSGCSFGNAGMIVPSHFVPLAAPGMVALGLKWMWNRESPFYVQPRFDWDLLTWAARFVCSANRQHVERSSPLLRDLHLASREAYLKFDEEGPDFGLVRKGLLMLCKTERALEEEEQTAKKARSLGLPAVLLDSRQAAALDPGVTMDIHGAVHFPLDCSLQPERFVAAMERRFREAGGEILFETSVTGWNKRGDRLDSVQTSAGEIESDEFVLCGGVWSAGMMRGLGLRLSMQAGKGYSVTLPDPPELPQICAIFAEARVAATPLGGTIRFGGTMEISGLDERIDGRRVRGIVRAASAYYPRFPIEAFEGLQPWSGLRPCSPDGLPYLGRTRAAKNLVVATGHAMMGLSLAPVTGEIAGQIVDGQPPRLDIRQLSPDRWG